MLRSKNFSLLIVYLFIFLCVISLTSASAAPNMLNYQGTLLDNSGNPITGTKNMVFKIYNVAAGGTALWSSNAMSVNVDNGWFNVAIEGIPENLFSEDTRYMEVVIGGEVLTLRKRMASVPYALNAGIANSGGIPAGGIIMWSGTLTSIPAGWVLCNGQNGTPDLRDRFIVGAGGAYAVKSTGGVITNNLSHSHTVNNHSHHIDVQFKSCIYDCTDINSITDNSDKRGINAIYFFLG
jgi:hypothetical protein